jgi:RecA-family ATPase
MTLHYFSGEPDDAPLTPLQTITPADWKDIEPVAEQWFALNRILGNDLTIISGDGGAGKTEMAVQLCVYGATGLGDWLGTTIESGPTLFYSAEEQEPALRKRVNRICKYRGIDPDHIRDLHLHFPDLEDPYLVTDERQGKMQKTPLMLRLEKTIAKIKPRLVVVDNVAAVFDGEAMARRQVRRFCAMLRKMVHKYETAVVLLDHPSLRGKTDGSGTSNSVDWRNSARSMLYLSELDRDNNPDERLMVVMKMNDGRPGETVKLRWNGITFTTAATCEPSPHKANANRVVDETFLRCLDLKVAQGVSVGSKPSRSGAAQVFAKMEEANGIKPSAFTEAQERLLSAGKIKIEPYGPPSHDKSRIVRT